MRCCFPQCLLGVVLLWSASSAARAADPQSYRVEFGSTDNAPLDAALRDTAELESLRKTAPVGPFGLIGRARGDMDRLKTVLESYGYYASTIEISIEGLGLNSPGLADALTALPKGRDARVVVSFTLGPLYHIGKVTVDGVIPSSAAGAFTLRTGAPAVAAEVLAAGSHLQAVLEEQGYAFAKVEPPVAYEDPKLPELDVTFTVTAGPRENLGEIHFKGLVRVHETLVRRRLLLHTGELYNPSGIEAARRDLLALGPFAAINVDVGRSVDSTGGVPVTFVFTERKRHQVSIKAAYSSDLGGSGGVSWTDRNVFGNAEQLNLAANVINLGGSNTTGVGYDTTAKFTIPEFGHRDQSLALSLGAIKQYLIAYDQKAVTSAVTLTRKVSSVWTLSAGVATSNEQILQDAAERTYTLVAVPLTATYDSTHLASPLDDPEHGMRDSLTVTPTQSLGRPNATFIISQIKIAAYVDLHHLLPAGESGRNIIAMRAVAGFAQGAGEFSLPPDQRFYAGGSSTIRGYPYQQVGPLFTNTMIPVGGTGLFAGSVEYRLRIGGNWGAAVFVDGGQVTSSLKPLPGDFRVGVGVGARYYTPIGPIRVDVAVPTHRDTTLIDGARESVDQAFQIYIGLGQAF